MKKNHLAIITLIFFIIGSIFMIFTKNTVLKSTLGILLMVLLIASNILFYSKRKKVLRDINTISDSLIYCKENSFGIWLSGFNLIIFSLSSLHILVNNKTMDVFLNGEEEIGGFLDFIGGVSSFEKISIFVYFLILVWGVSILFGVYMSFVVIGNGEILSSNNTNLTFADITDIKYKDPLFAKKKIITFISKDGHYKEIVVKSKDYEKVKSYIDDNIALQ